MNEKIWIATFCAAFGVVLIIFGGSWGANIFGSLCILVAGVEIFHEWERRREERQLAAISKAYETSDDSEEPHISRLRPYPNIDLSRAVNAQGRRRLQAIRRKNQMRSVGKERAFEQSLQQQRKESLAAISHLESVVRSQPSPREKRLYNFSDAIGVVGNFTTLGTLIIFGSLLEAFAMGVSVDDLGGWGIPVNGSPSQELAIDVMAAVGRGIALLSAWVWTYYSIWVFFIYLVRGVGWAWIIGPIIGLVSVIMLVAVLSFSYITFIRVLSDTPPLGETPGQRSMIEKLGD